MSLWTPDAGTGLGGAGLSVAGFAQRQQARAGPPYPGCFGVKFQKAASGLSWKALIPPRLFVSSFQVVPPMEPSIVANAALPDVRKALQLATAHLHAEVDSALPLASPAATLAEYREHLVVLLDWMTGLQPAHPALSGWLDTHRERLQRDLDVCATLLSDDPRTGPVATLPVRPEAAAAGAMAPTAAADNTDGDWGVAYVIEGSQLGGQVMYRRLAEALAPHPLGYLRGADSVNGRTWPAFLADLRLHVVTSVQQESACRGAVQAFEALLHCFRARRAGAGVLS